MSKKYALVLRTCNADMSSRGENGIKPNVAYRLNMQREFVEVK